MQPQSIKQVIGMQLSRFSDLTRELIFDLLFRFCQIIVSWLQIKLSPQKHFFYEGHSFSQCNPYWFYIAISSAFRMCENCPFGKSISVKLSFWAVKILSASCRWTGKRREDVSSGLCLLEGSCMPVSVAFLSTQNYVDVDCFFLVLVFEMSFLSIFSFCFSMGEPQGRRDGGLGYTPLCI